jgi:hypothetical protein
MLMADTMSIFFVILGMMLTTLDLLKRVETLRGRQYKPEGGAVYLDDTFGQGLKEVARLIKASIGLEVACLDLGGLGHAFLSGQLERPASLTDLATSMRSRSI